MAIHVKCPCCRTELTVDQETGAILSFEEEKRKAKDFDSFLAEQKNRSASLEEKFRAAQEAERNRKAVLERKFELAKEKPLDDNAPPIGIQWD